MFITLLSPSQLIKVTHLIDVKLDQDLDAVLMSPGFGFLFHA